MLVIPNCTWHKFHKWREDPQPRWNSILQLIATIGTIGITRPINMHSMSLELDGSGQQ
jgi:hypothetical protein